MISLAIALCLPLLCSPSLEEQIQAKKDEIREIDLAREAENFDFREQFVRERFERSQMRRRGVPIENTAEIDRLKAKLHQDALAEIDRRRTTRERELRALECKLEERQTADLKAKGYVRVEFEPDPRYPWSNDPPKEPCPPK